MSDTYKDIKSTERREKTRIVDKRRFETRVRPGDAYLDVLVVY